MGSVGLKWRDRIFLTIDNLADIWFFLLASEIKNHVVDPPLWLNELAEKWWWTQVDTGGVIDTGLDEYIISSQRRDILLDVVLQMENRVRESFTHISAEWMNEHQISGWTDWGDGYSVERILDLSSKFKQMLREGNPPNDS